MIRDTKQRFRTRQIGLQAIGVGALTLWLMQGCAPVAQKPAEPPKPVAVAPAASVTQAAPAPAPPPPPPVPVALPHQEALLAAAREVFGNAQLAEGQKYTVLIDPLVDGTTGMQTVATAAIEQKLVSLVNSDYAARYQVRPLNAANLAALPLIFIGTFTPINLQGKGAGERDAYRICFALADLKSGKIVSKGFARSQTAGFDPTPLPYFQDAPLWVSDKVVDGYVRTCQGTKAGDPINPAYLDKVVAEAGIDAATKAYNAKKYPESLALFNALLKTPAGDQPRVHTGIYLANLKLGRREPAMKSFGTLAQQGLQAKRLAVRMNFQPGSAILARDPNPYDRWIKELAVQSAKAVKDGGGCLEVGAHTGRAGSESLNERVSLQRAEYVRQRLIAEQASLSRAVSSKGYGSREAMIATAREDSSDGLDRRVELRSAPCAGA